MNVTVIIVTFNSSRYIMNCVSSLLKSGVKSGYEIIIIDNNSSDDTVALLKNNYPGIKLVENKENMGFGKAVNIALEQTNSEFVLLLNPDTVVLNNPVDIFSDFMKRNQSAASCGGSLFDSDLKPVISYGFFPSLLQVFFEETGLRKIFRKYYFNKLSPGCILTEEKTIPFEVDYASGADLFFRRSAAEKTGNLDKDFFMYYEETELCYRFRKSGFKNFIVPEARFIHHEGGSLSGISLEKFEMMKKSEFLYFRKCRGVLSVYIAKILYVFGALMKVFFRWDNTQLKKIIIICKS